MIDFLDKVHDHEPRQIEPRIEPVNRQDNEPSRRQKPSIGIAIRKVFRIGESDQVLCAHKRFAQAAPPPHNDIEYKNKASQWQRPLSFLASLPPSLSPFLAGQHSTLRHIP